MSKRRDNGALGKQVGGLQAQARAHETRDLNLRVVAIAGVLLLAGMALMLIITVGVQLAYVGQLPCLCPPNGVFSANPSNPLPSAVTRRQNPDAVMQQYLSEEDARLHTYGWLDQNAGVVHIPIERAIDALLQRGLPTRLQSESDQFQDKADTLPSYSSSGRTTERR